MIEIKNVFLGKTGPFCSLEEYVMKRRDFNMTARNCARKSTIGLRTKM